MEGRRQRGKMETCDPTQQIHRDAIKALKVSTTGVSQDNIETVKHLLLLYKANYRAKLESDCDALVVQNELAVPPSAKLLAARRHGIPCVSYQWLTHGKCSQLTLGDFDICAAVRGKRICTTGMSHSERKRAERVCGWSFMTDLNAECDLLVVAATPAAAASSKVAFARSHRIPCMSADNFFLCYEERSRQPSVLSTEAFYRDGARVSDLPASLVSYAGTQGLTALAANSQAGGLLPVAVPPSLPCGRPPLSTSQQTPAPLQQGQAHWAETTDRMPELLSDVCVFCGLLPSTNALQEALGLAERTGAAVATTLFDVRVTHVLMATADETLTTACAALPVFVPRAGQEAVTVRWLEECERQRSRVPCGPYRVVLPATGTETPVLSFTALPPHEVRRLTAALEGAGLPARVQRQFVLNARPGGVHGDLLNTTHLLVPSEKLLQSEKVKKLSMLAQSDCTTAGTPVLRRCLVVSVEWAVQSAQQRRWLDVEPFVLPLPNAGDFERRIAADTLTSTPVCPTTLRVPATRCCHQQLDKLPDSAGTAEETTPARDFAARAMRDSANSVTPAAESRKPSPDKDTPTVAEVAVGSECVAEVEQLEKSESPPGASSALAGPTEAAIPAPSVVQVRVPDGGGSAESIDSAKGLREGSSLSLPMATTASQAADHKPTVTMGPAASSDAPAPSCAACEDAYMESETLPSLSLQGALDDVEAAVMHGGTLPDGGLLGFPLEWAAAGGGQLITPTYGEANHSRRSADRAEVPSVHTRFSDSRTSGGSVKGRNNVSTGSACEESQMVVYDRRPALPPARGSASGTAGLQSGAAPEAVVLFVDGKVLHRENGDDATVELLIKRVYECNPSWRPATTVEETTHFVTSVPESTVQILSCIAAGKWVLRTSFLTAAAACDRSTPLEAAAHEWTREGAQRLGFGSLAVDLAGGCERQRKLVQRGCAPFAHWRFTLTCSSAARFDSFKRVLISGGCQHVESATPETVLAGLQRAGADTGVADSPRERTRVVASGCEKEQQSSSALEDVVLTDKRVWSDEHLSKFRRLQLSDTHRGVLPIDCIMYLLCHGDLQPAHYEAQLAKWPTKKRARE